MNRKILDFGAGKKSVYVFQVQIVVYETHSRLELENGGMVKAAVEEMNGWAYEKHNVDNYSSASAEDNKFGTSVETPWRPAVFQPVEVVFP